MDLIVNNLYLGDIQGASNFNLLKRNVKNSDKYSI